MTAFAVSSENNRFAALDAKTVEFICPDQAVPDETAASKNWNLVEEKVTEDKEDGLVYVDRMYMDGPAVSTVSYTPFTRSVERSRSIYKASSNLSYGELILTNVCRRNVFVKRYGGHTGKGHLWIYKV